MSLKSIFISERNRWILWLPIFFCIGIFLFFKYKIFNEKLLYLLILQIISLIIFRKKEILKFFILPVIFLSCGYVRSMYFYKSFDFPKLKYDTGYVNVCGTITNTYLKKSSKGNLYREAILEVEKIEKTEKSFKNFINDENFKTPKKILIRFNYDTILEEGKVKINTILYPITKKQHFTSFDFEEYYYFKKIGGIGYKGKILEFKKTKIKKDFFDKINNFRYKYSEKIIEILDDDSGSIIATLITGNKKVGNQDTIKLMNNAGLAHLLAISGIHMMTLITITTMIIKWILLRFEKIALNYDVFKISAGISLVLNFFYLALSGFGISAIRAYLMCVVVLFAIILERFNNPLRSVFFVMLLMTFVNPYSIFNPGFQMSFSAVIGLIAGYEYYADKKENPNSFISIINSSKFFKYIFGIFFTSIIAEMATTPFSLYHFNVYTFYNVFANFIAVPLVSIVILPLSMISLPLYFISFGLEKFVLIPAGWGVNIIIKVCEYIENIEDAIIFIPSPCSLSMFLMIFGGIWFCIWQKKWRIWGIYIYFVGVFVIFFQREPDLIIDYKNNNFVLTDNEYNLYPVGKINKFTLNTWLLKFGKEKAFNYKELFNNKCSLNGCTKLIKKKNSYLYYKNTNSIEIKYNYKNKIYIDKENIKIKKVNNIDFIYLK